MTNEHFSLNGEALFPLIPQRPPFVLVDTLLQADSLKAKSSFAITKTCILVSDETLQEGGIVENMAQTCALYAGNLAIKNNQPTPQGYIAGIKSLIIDRLPRIGDQITTEVNLKQEVMNMTIATAIVHDQNDNFVASCEFRIFIKASD